MTDLDFADAVVPDYPDSVPPTSDVEYPCEVCRKEAGPYGGRGPKPKYCPDHKKNKKATARATPRVTGNASSLAAQATTVLVQVNAIIAMGATALGLFRTGSAIAAANDGFEQQAYLALTTDPELCKFLLKGGLKSAKITLAIAYGGMGMAVVPVAVEEVREKRAEAAMRKAQADDANGT